MSLAHPLSSHRAIENLIATYAELVDDGDFAGVGSLLADATFVGAAGSVSGQAEIEKMLRDNVIVYDDGTPRTNHITTNLAIEIDEDAGTAISRSYFTALQALPDLALQPIVTADEIRSDAPFDETPLPVSALEAVVVPYFGHART